MSDHFHLILTPTQITLERAMQLMKGGFSFRLNKNLRVKREVWQPSFMDRRIRDSLEYQKFKDYIWQNPVKRFLAKSPEEYSYSSANSCFTLHHPPPLPARLKDKSQPLAAKDVAPAPQRLHACRTLVKIALRSNTLKVHAPVVLKKRAFCRPAQKTFLLPECFIHRTNFGEPFSGLDPPAWKQHYEGFPCTKNSQGENQ
jgi:hypothetical protein